MGSGPSKSEKFEVASTEQLSRFNKGISEQIASVNTDKGLSLEERRKTIKELSKLGDKAKSDFNKLLEGRDSAREALFKRSGPNRSNNTQFQKEFAGINKKFESDSASFFETQAKGLAKSLGNLTAISKSNKEELESSKSQRDSLIDTPGINALTRGRR